MISLKHRLLLKSFFLLLIFISSIHLVSVSQLHHPISLENVFAVENEATFGLTLVEEEDHNYIDLFSTASEMEYSALIALTLLLFSFFAIWKKNIMQFLYAVFYQSSYFSNNHL